MARTPSPQKAQDSSAVPANLPGSEVTEVEKEEDEFFIPELPEG